MILFGLQLLIHAAPGLVFKTLAPRVRDEKGERRRAFLAGMSAGC